MRAEARRPAMRTPASSSQGLPQGRRIERKTMNERTDSRQGDAAAAAGQQALWRLAQPILSFACRVKPPHYDHAELKKKIKTSNQKPKIKANPKSANRRVLASGRDRGTTAREASGAARARARAKKMTRHRRSTNITCHTRRATLTNNARRQGVKQHQLAERSTDHDHQRGVDARQVWRRENQQARQGAAAADARLFGPRSFVQACVRRAAPIDRHRRWWQAGR